MKKGFKHSEETKRKIREGHLGVKTGRSWNKGKKTPVSVRLKISNSLKGEKGTAWKGGISSKNLRIRRSVDNRLWREAVFARDNFTCQKTGQKGWKIVAHHIFNFAQYPELRFAIDNGITLSKESHQEFHKIYGIKNNTRDQLEEFLGKKII